MQHQMFSYSSIFSLYSCIFNLNDAMLQWFSNCLQLFLTHYYLSLSLSMATFCLFNRIMRTITTNTILLVNQQSVISLIIHKYLQKYQHPFPFHTFHTYIVFILFQYSISIMQSKINQVDFQIAVSSFHDEVFSRLDYINTIQIEFLRRYECQINIPDSHVSLVFYLRNIIASVQQTYKDVQSYFTDLGMPFAYDFFRKIQMLMVNGYNFLSQALLIRIDQQEQEREHRSKNRDMEVLLMASKPKQEEEKEQSKQLERFDYAINFFENEENKLSQELHKIQENILMSKGLVQKLHASKAVKELTEIKERAQITLQNTQKIFQETYQLKYLEFKQYLAKLQKPQDLTKQFCNNIKVAMKDKFTEGMKKSVNVMYGIIKEDIHSKCRHISTQTEEADHPKLEKKAVVPKNNQKLHNLLIKERKLTEKLLIQMQIFKRQVQNLTTDKLRMLNNIKELDLKLSELNANYTILQSIYEQKRDQALHLKKQLDQKCIYLDKLKGIQIKYLHHYITSDYMVQVEMRVDSVDVNLQTGMEDNQIITILKKTNDKMGERIREKEMKIREIQKNHINQKKEKMKRMRISQSIAPQSIVPQLTIQEEDQRKESEKEIQSGSDFNDSRTSSGKNKQDECKAWSGDLGSKNKVLKLTRFSVLRNKNPGNAFGYNEKNVVEIAIQTQIDEQVKVIVSTQKIDIEMQTDLQIELQNHGEYISKLYERQNLTKRTKVSRGSAFQLLQKLPKQGRKTHLHDNISGERSKNRNQSHIPSEYFNQSNSVRMKREVTNQNQYEDIQSLANIKEQRKGLFQNLNIETQEMRVNNIKRTTIAKNFLYHITTHRKKEESLDAKNKTCADQFYKVEEQSDPIQEKNVLFAVDKCNMIRSDKNNKKNTIFSTASSKKLISNLAIKSKDSRKMTNL